MSTLTRKRSKFEESEKKKWAEKYEEHLQILRTPSLSPADYFRKRCLARPPTIILKKLPDYKSPNSFYSNRVIYFLEMALLFLINAENIQLWCFEDKFLPYFVADFDCGDQRADHLVMRLVERMDNPNIAREPVDDFLDEIGDPVRLIILGRQDVPNTLKFALHVLSLEGPVEERLQLHKSPAELEIYINKVVGEEVFFKDLSSTHDLSTDDLSTDGLPEEKDDLSTHGLPEEKDDLSTYGLPEEKEDVSSIDMFPDDLSLEKEKEVCIIDLLDDDDEDDLPISRKRSHEEIIDLTCSD